MFLRLIIYAASRIADFNLKLSFPILSIFMLRNNAQGNINASAIRGELIGIRKQIVHYLTEFIIVKRHHQRVYRSIESQGYAWSHQLLERITDFMNKRNDISCHQFHLLTILIYLSEIKQLIHQPQQTRGITGNQLQLRSLRLIFLLTYQNRQRRQYQRQRCTQFMTDICKEIKLHLIKVPRLFSFTRHLCQP